MKKFTFLLFILFAAFSARCQAVKLSVSNVNNYPLRIMVDGKTYNYNKDPGEADFVLSDLRAGAHRVQIYRLPVRARRGDFSSNAIQLMYDETLYLRLQSFTDLLVNRFGHIFKDELIEGSTGTNPGQTPHFPPEHFYEQMNAANFDGLKSSLRNESFDNSRLNIAKQAAAANYFSAAQVKEIMLLFSYDESRLEIAKAFYPRTVDKGNYFTVNDAFSYSSSKDQLAAFIRQNP